MMPARNAETTVAVAIRSVTRGLPRDGRVLVLDDATKTDLRQRLSDAIGTSEITVSGTPRAMIARRR